MTDQIVWHQETRKITQLKPYERNPRRISKTSYQKLLKSLKELGYSNRIKINKDNTIVGGHQRLRALKELGFKEVEVLVPNRQLTIEEFKQDLITDNLLFGEFDMDMISSDFDVADLIEWGMPPEWIAEPEVEILEGEDDIISEPDLNKQPISKYGNVWILGNHRLMCGDSTLITDVEELINDINPDIIYTDPPYGININFDENYTKSGGKNKEGRRRAYGKIENDNTTNVARDSFNLITTMFECNVVFWGANYFTDFLPPSKCWIAWDKRGKMEENTFCGAELAYTNSNKHSVVLKVLWNGLHREGESNKDPRVHPTQKPIKLALDCFDYLEAGNVVLDLFGGSGTTLIACEKSNRQCLMMELSPHYCDIIIQRWEKLTEVKAVLEQSNNT